MLTCEIHTFVTSWFDRVVIICMDWILRSEGRVQLQELK